MYRLFFIVSDLLSAAVVLIPFLLLLLSVLWNGNSPRRRGLLLIFTLFIVAVYSAVGLPSIAGIHVDPEVHLIPLLDGWSSPPVLPEKHAAQHAALPAPGFFAACFMGRGTQLQAGVFVWRLPLPWD